MIKRLLALFRKSPEPEAEPKKKSLIDKARAKDVGTWTKPAIDANEIMARNFPRKHSDLKRVTAAGVAMDSDAVATMDASFDTSNLYPNDISDQILEFFGNHSFIGWQACALLRQHYLIDAACSIPANDAMAPGYTVSYAENNEHESDKKKDDGMEDEELVEIVEVAEDKYKISEICRRLTINKKTFGIGIAIPIVDDADMSKPFNIDGVKKGSFKGWSIVEPYWLSPQMDAAAASDPASGHFYEPTWWKVGGGELVHRSWLIKVVNTVLPDIMKPTYYYGGVPLTQMIYERVYAADKTANEAPNLAMSKRMLVADADVDNLIANPEEASTIVKAISYMRDNFGVWFKRTGDQVAQIDTNLAGLEETIMTQYQLVASIAEMPATKLLKTTPKGFNATGEYEWKDYAQTLVEIQEHDYTPLIKMHNELYTKSTTGKEIPLTVQFNPVDMPTDKELAEVEEIRSRIDTNYVTSGVISVEEAREVARNAEGSRYSTLPEVSEYDERMDKDAEALAAKVAGEEQD